MSQSNEPTSVEQVWEQLKKWTLENQNFSDAWEHEDWVRAKIDAAKARFPFMRNATVGDYSGYMIRQMADENQKAAAARYIPNLTERDFWDAVYQFDPLGPGQPEVSRLEKIYESGQLETLTLGQIYGKTTLKLLPCQGALPTTESRSFKPPFGYAVTIGGAVSYPDGHPSEEMALPYLKGSTSRSKGDIALPTIRDNDDDTLRRFASLGYVLQESRFVEGAWEKTGHVLVIDMGDRRVRHRSPWFILASEWPTDGEETGEGDFYYRAKEHVRCDDAAGPGVFPGDLDRTPICRIDPMTHDDERPVIRKFGKDFLFNPIRIEGCRDSDPSSEYGPSLAHVMDWYWDPDAERQVCYTKQGLEYMRFDSETKEYSYPDLDKMLFEGEHGLFGDLKTRIIIGIYPQATTEEEDLHHSSIDDDLGSTHRPPTSSESDS